MDFDTAIEKIRKAQSPEEIKRIILNTNPSDRDAVQDYVNAIGD